MVRGRLEVLVGNERRILGPGEHVTVPASTRHTFATVDPDGADVFCVMTPEVDRLVTELHQVPAGVDRAEVWSRYRSETVPGPG